MTAAPESQITIVEVGPRDGLQNELDIIPTAAKIRFVEDLAATGAAVVETTSFVSPKAVPQLADAEAVLSGIRRRPGVRYLVLVPNDRGLDRALEAGADSIALFAAATDAFSQANLGAPMEAALARFAAVAARARPQNLWLRGYVSVAFGCPYSGDVDPQQVIDVASRLFEFGCAEVALADTIGRTGPEDIEILLTQAASKLPVSRLALHLHDTSGRAVDNVAASLPFGIRTFDGSAGGLGGCPFAPGAPGNLATESLVDSLEAEGFATGVDSTLVRQAVARLRSGSSERSHLKTAD